MRPFPGRRLFPKRLPRRRRNIFSGYSTKKWPAAGPIASIVVFVIAYSFFVPFGLSLGVAVLLLLHEIGHVIAAKKKGLPVTAPVFIPFIGALILLKRNPRNAETEAFIAFGGPLLGTLGACAVYGLGNLWGIPLLAAVADIGFLFNLINLLPIRPLDGGRIAVAVSRWLWLLGLIAGLGFVLYFQLYWFLFVWCLFAWELVRQTCGGKGKPKKLSVFSHARISAGRMEEKQMAELFGKEPVSLPFTAYSDLSGQQFVKFWWDACRLRETVRMPGPAIVHQVTVHSVSYERKGRDLHVTVRSQIEHHPYIGEAYYEVSLRNRWKFGLAYASLTAFLVYMIYETNRRWIAGAL